MELVPTSTPNIIFELEVFHFRTSAELVRFREGCITERSIVEPVQVERGLHLIQRYLALPIRTPSLVFPLP